jgi:HSP90 family molecular chaperone
MASKKILEINLHHKIIKGLKEKNESTKNVIRLLFESAMLESGF